MRSCRGATPGSSVDDSSQIDIATIQSSEENAERKSRQVARREQEIATAGRMLATSWFNTAVAYFQPVANARSPPVCGENPCGWAIRGACAGAARKTSKMTRCGGPPACRRMVAGNSHPLGPPAPTLAPDACFVLSCISNGPRGLPRGVRAYRAACPDAARRRRVWRYRAQGN